MFVEFKVILLHIQYLYLCNDWAPCVVGVAQAIACGACDNGLLFNKRIDCSKVERLAAQVRCASPESLFAKQSKPFTPAQVEPVLTQDCADNSQLTLKMFLNMNYKGNLDRSNSLLHNSSHISPDMIAQCIEKFRKLHQIFPRPDSCALTVGVVYPQQFFCNSMSRQQPYYCIATYDA